MHNKLVDVRMCSGLLCGQWSNFGRGCVGAPFDGRGVPGWLIKGGSLGEHAMLCCVLSRCMTVCDIIVGMRP